MRRGSRRWQKRSGSIGAAWSSQACRWAATSCSRFFGARNCRFRGLIPRRHSRGSGHREGARRQAEDDRARRRRGSGGVAREMVPKLLGETTKRERPEAVSRFSGVNNGELGRRDQRGHRRDDDSAGLDGSPRRFGSDADRRGRARVLDSAGANVPKRSRVEFAAHAPGSHRRGWPLMTSNSPEQRRGPATRLRTSFG